MSTRGTTAEIVYQRSELPLIKMILVIKTQIGLFYDTDEILNEAHEKFIKLFDYYEEDKQYLNFMFSVIKNMMRDIRKREIKFHKFHVTTSSANMVNDNKIGEDNTLEQLAEDKVREINPASNMETMDMVEMIRTNLKREVHREIFLRIVENKSNVEIAQELGFSASYVSVIRVRYIWPIVKKIMNISDDVYFRLTDSGRINCALTIDVED